MNGKLIIEIEETDLNIMVDSIKLYKERVESHIRTFGEVLDFKKEAERCDFLINKISNVNP